FDPKGPIDPKGPTEPMPIDPMPPLPAPNPTPPPAPGPYRRGHGLQHGHGHSGQNQSIQDILRALQQLMLQLSYQNSYTYYPAPDQGTGGTMAANIYNGPMAATDPGNTA